MTYVVTRRPLKLTNDKTFEVGDFITDEDFKEIPERILISRKRSLIEAGRIERTESAFTQATEKLVAPTAKAKAVLKEVGVSQAQNETEVVYLPIGRWKLPNGDIVKGKKEDALKRLAELKAGD